MHPSSSTLDGQTQWSEMLSKILEEAGERLLHGVTTAEVLLEQALLSFMLSLLRFFFSLLFALSLLFFFCTLSFFLFLLSPYFARLNPFPFFIVVESLSHGQMIMGYFCSFKSIKARLSSSILDVFITNLENQLAKVNVPLDLQACYDNVNRMSEGSLASVLICDIGDE